MERGAAVRDWAGRRGDVGGDAALPFRAGESVGLETEAQIALSAGDLGGETPVPMPMDAPNIIGRTWPLALLGRLRTRLVGLLCLRTKADLGLDILVAPFVRFMSVAE